MINLSPFLKLEPLQRKIFKSIMSLILTLETKDFRKSMKKQGNSL